MVIIDVSERLYSSPERYKNNLDIYVPSFQGCEKLVKDRYINGKPSYSTILIGEGEG